VAITFLATVALALAGRFLVRARMRVL